MVLDKAKSKWAPTRNSFEKNKVYYQLHRCNSKSKGCRFDVLRFEFENWAELLINQCYGLVSTLTNGPQIVDTSSYLSELMNRIIS